MGDVREDAASVHAVRSLRLCITPFPPSVSPLEGMDGVRIGRIGSGWDVWFCLYCWGMGGGGGRGDWIMVSPSCWVAVVVGFVGVGGLLLLLVVLML